MKETDKRLDAEWLALSAVRDVAKIASRGDMQKSTYAAALDFGGALYPELLGPDTSLLRREIESDTTKEYRQRANLLSLQKKERVYPSTLVQNDLKELKDLLEIAKREEKKERVDQLKKRYGQLLKAEQELTLQAHSENQLIFRDAYNVERHLPSPNSGCGYRDFQLPDSKILRVRVLHPDKPEHITGADIIYERHDPFSDSARIVAVQYKIWEERKLYLADKRLKEQLEKLEGFACKNPIEMCKLSTTEETYRFPCCAAFLRPTDKLQRSDQKLLSTGEHLPICRIEGCASIGPLGGKILEYANIKDVSISGDIFQELFNRGKIGSRELSYNELTQLYGEYLALLSTSEVVLHVQEFDG